MKIHQKAPSHLLVFSIFTILHVSGSAGVSLQLRVEPNTEYIVENDGLKFTCRAERVAGGAKDWYEMEVAVARTNSKEVLCYRYIFSSSHISTRIIRE